MNDTHQHDQTEVIELPQPTASPMVCAFGFALMAAGIVTNWIVAIAGSIIMLVGATAWFMNSNPHSREIEASPEKKPRPIEPRTGVVDHLIEDSSHRARLPLEIHPYSAGITGGLIGGIAMALCAVLWGWFAHGSMWYTVNLLAGTMLTGYADMSMAELYAFHTEGLIVGLVIQAFMSIAVGLLYGVTLPLIPRGQIMVSAIIIPLIWSGLTWASISVVNPALAEHIEWFWFICSQIVFGVVTGWWIVRTEKISTMQNWHYLERLGMETPGVRDMGGES
ncbi:MAG: hypothetical protein MK100_02320 [Phycisphaerales bacterium]|nr:hypothetical protein [Phycisphaerales bacterium]